MLQVGDASPVTLTVPFQDAAGNALVVTAVAWQLYDEDDEIVALGTSAPTAGATDVDIAIGGGFNAIATPRSARRLAVTLTTAAGKLVVEQFYTIAKASVLTPPENSFMTYTRALALRDGLVGAFDGWDGAEQRERVAALETAFVKLGRLCYLVTPLGDGSSYASFDDDDGSGTTIIVRDVRTLPADMYRGINPGFRASLERAQILEASAMLGGGSVEQRRADGVLSETIGESSMMFVSRAALQLPLSREAYREVAPFVYRVTATARG